MWAKGLVLLIVSGLMLTLYAETEIFQAHLVKFEPEGDSVVLKRAGRAELSVSLHKKARLWLNRQPASLESFREMVGKPVMVRLSVGTATRPILREMADPDTWKWLERVRRGVVQGTLMGIEEEYLIVEFADRTRFVYKINPSTRFVKKGQPATPEAFQAGEKIYLAPRLLSNLDTMALVVSDSEQQAAIGRERTLPTVRGTLQAIDKNAQMLKVRTQAGDVRQFRYDEKTVFTLKGKAVAIDKIKLPVQVVVHRRRDEAGNDYAHRVTLQAGK